MTSEPASHRRTREASHHSAARALLKEGEQHIVKSIASTFANLASPFTASVTELKARSNAAEASVAARHPVRPRSTSPGRVALGSIVVLGGTSAGVVHILAGEGEVASAEEAGPFAVFNVAVGAHDVGAGVGLIVGTWTLGGYLIWSGLEPGRQFR